MDKSRYGLSWIYEKTKGCRLVLVIYLLLVLLIPVIQLLFAYCMKLFIDIATGSLNMPLFYVGLGSISAIIAGGIVVMINTVLARYISGKIERNLRAELMDVIFSRRLINISRQHTGELLTRLTSDVSAVSMCPAVVIDDMAGQAASGLLATAALFFLNWKIAVILLILTPILMFLMGSLTPLVRKASTADKLNDEMNRSLMQENLSRIMLIKMYFMQDKTIEKVKRIYENKLKSAMKLGMWEGLAMFAGALFGNIMSLVTLGLGAFFVLNGETTVGSLIMMVQLLNYIVAPFSTFSAAIGEIGQAVASSGRIGMIYDLPEENLIPTSSVPVHVSELVVRNLCFSYDDESGENLAGMDSGKSCLLNDINMSFPKGEITGIVGKSGSGKSTLLKLLTGLYSPLSGTVELKHDAGRLTGAQILAQVAYVPPGDYLFSGTVSDNIIMSEQEPRNEEMQTAASDANILEFIRTLPNGFDTFLGESGGTVSSGQAQRIAIARAIYKNAPIIVFDEPTANLDADSIKAFQAAVKNLANDRICIIVTHDSTTMTSCDKIYVLEPV